MLAIPVEQQVATRPCLIVVQQDPAGAALVARAFRRLGWDVYPAADGPQARRLARMLRPALVVLDADLPGESGWLTCDKLTDELPDVRVVLTLARPAERDQHFAAFVGAAALVDRRDPAALLAQAPAPLHAAG
jgi:DNA-binding response OmpR family regulator